MGASKRSALTKLAEGANVAACTVLLLPPFLLSGACVTAVLLVLFAVLWPLRREWFERCCAALVPLAANSLVVVPEWWAGVNLRCYGDTAAWEAVGRDNGIMMCNHRSDIDWLTGWAVGIRVGALGSYRAIMKRSALFVPVLGTLWWLSGYVFITRNWMKDKDLMLRSFANINASPLPYMLVLFAEGTRFTHNKLKIAQEFAKSKGMPVPKHTLVPKTRGFVAVASNLAQSVDAVYDVTFMPAEGKPAPSLFGLFCRRPAEIHVHVRRIDAKELPEGEHELKEWCLDLFRSKDAALEAHAKANRFDAPEYVGAPRRLDTLLIALFWVCAYAYLMWTYALPAVASLAAEGKTRLIMRIGAAGVVAAVMLVRTFIRASSAKTTDVKVPKQA